MWPSEPRWFLRQMGTIAQEDLQALMERYGFRIVDREKVASGPAPWGGRRLGPNGLPVYDPAAYWQRTRYTVHRELTCERCGFRFGYAFQVEQRSRTHRMGGSSDNALYRAIRRQLRRKVKCPSCGWIQEEPRRSLIRKDVQETLLGCLTVALPIPLIVGLTMAGYTLLGSAGAMIGIILGVLLSFGLFGFMVWRLLWAEPR